MNQQSREQAALEAQMMMPIEASMMPELEPMEFWSRTVHELMYAANPQMMLALFQEGKLTTYLDNQQELLSEAARALEKQYRQMNPLPPTATHIERTSWHKTAQSFSRETLLNEVSLSLIALSEEQSRTSQ
jgi:hypothetical protein